MKSVELVFPPCYEKSFSLITFAHFTLVNLVGYKKLKYTAASNQANTFIKVIPLDTEIVD